MDVETSLLNVSVEWYLRKSVAKKEKFDNFNHL